MTSSLPAPGWSSLVTQWTWQPLAIVAVLALAAWYARGVRVLRSRGAAWPVRRSVTFGVGLVALLWTTCGFAGAYIDAAFWVWTAQQLALLLVIPYVLMAGGPLQLAQAVSGRNGTVEKFLRSGFVRVFGNPLIGPALVPVLSVVLFFGPLPGWAIDVRPLSWLLALALVAVGAVIVLPLVGDYGPRTSLAVGLSLAIGSFELVLDAFPGIVLRLHRSVSTGYFDHRALHEWTLGAVHDQQIAGAVLWCTAELLDLPFLILVFRQWLRADARDAADIDAVLEAERIARRPQEFVAGAEPTDVPSDAPWWLTDPAMQTRLRRRD